MHQPIQWVFPMIYAFVCIWSSETFLVLIRLDSKIILVMQPAFHLCPAGCINKQKLLTIRKNCIVQNERSKKKLLSLLSLKCWSVSSRILSLCFASQSGASLLFSMIGCSTRKYLHPPGVRHRLLFESIWEWIYMAMTMINIPHISFMGNLHLERLLRRLGARAWGKQRKGCLACRWGFALRPAETELSLQRNYSSAAPCFLSYSNFMHTDAKQKPLSGITFYS